MTDSLLNYYQQELVNLQASGKQFSHDHPGVANYLNFDQQYGEDPHIARLVQSIAFLNARVSKKLDDEIPNLQQAFLNVLYPHYQKPLPAMAMIQFISQPDTQGYCVEQGTELETDPSLGPVCRFQTCCDTTVLPFEVSTVDYTTQCHLPPNNFNKTTAPAVIKVTLKLLNSDIDFVALTDQPLRFQLDGQPAQKFALLELLCEQLSAFGVGDDKQCQQLLPTDLIQPAGLSAADNVLPHYEQSLDNYRLLSELFAFPEKFAAIDVNLSDIDLSAYQDSVSLYFFLQSLPTTAPSLSSNNFKLGCTPIINLFNQPIEPINLTERTSEYPLVADIRRLNDFEIYQLSAVTAFGPQGETRSFQPLYGLQHNQDSNAVSYWHMTTRLHQAPPNHVISLVDINGDFINQDGWVLSAQATCSNGNLPLACYRQYPQLGLQFVTDSGPIESIHWLTPPTPNYAARTQQDLLWGLNAHLALNFSTLLQPDGHGLRELLTLYDRTNTPETRQLCQCISHVESRQTTARVYQQGVACICQGLAINLYTNDQNLQPGRLWLLTKVLERVLSAYSPLNSFIQLNVIDAITHQERYQWPAFAGNKPLL